MRVRVAEAGADGGEEPELDPALPLLDLHLLHDIAAQHVGLGLQGFQIAGDGDGLGQDLAIVEFERGDLGDADLGEEFGGLVLARDQVDLDPGDLDPLLGDEDVHAPRVGRARLVVEADGLGKGHG